MSMRRIFRHSLFLCQIRGGMYVFITNSILIRKVRNVQGRRKGGLGGPLLKCCGIHHLIDGKLVAGEDKRCHWVFFVLFRAAMSHRSSVLFKRFGAPGPSIKKRPVDFLGDPRELGVRKPRTRLANTASLALVKLQHVYLTSQDS